MYQFSSSTTPCCRLAAGSWCVCTLLWRSCLLGVHANKQMLEDKPSKLCCGPFCCRDFQQPKQVYTIDVYCTKMYIPLSALSNVCLYWTGICAIAVCVIFIVQLLRVLRVSKHTWTRGKTFANLLCGLLRSQLLLWQSCMLPKLQGGL